MKVILLKDIHKVGQRYDVKEVAPGFAMNQLIPQKLAERATPAAMKALEAKRAEVEAKRAQEMEALLADAGKIESAEVEMEAKANDKGHLFAGIDADAISKAIGEAAGITLSPKFIELKEPLKEVGTHEVIVKIGEKEVKARVQIKAL